MRAWRSGDTTLMFGSGTKVNPARGGEAAWDVTCYRATTTGPAALARRRRRRAVG